MRGHSIALFAGASLMLSGCLAKTVVDVATLPVRAAGKAVDLATTSQSEADENRGRELRKREEKLGKLNRTYEKQRAKCDEGDEKSCEAARASYAELQELLPAVSLESRLR